MRTLCHQYLSTALTHLLNKPLPWDEWVNSHWPLSLALLIACSYCVARNFLWEKFSPILPYQRISIFCNASVAGIGEILSSEYFQLHVFNSNNMVMLHVLSICRQMVAMVMYMYMYCQYAGKWLLCGRFLLAMRVPSLRYSSTFSKFSPSASPTRRKQRATRSSGQRQTYLKLWVEIDVRTMNGISMHLKICKSVSKWASWIKLCFMYPKATNFCVRFIYANYAIQALVA